MKAWQNLEVGDPVYALDDLAATKGWLDRASVQYIPLQTGIWHIYIEPGYSVFRIYPYWAEGDPQPRIYQSIVLKVAGHLSEAELIAAIRERKETVVIDEYELIGKDISIQKYSRRKRHVPGGIRIAHAGRPTTRWTGAAGACFTSNLIRRR